MDNKILYISKIYKENIIHKTSNSTLIFYLFIFLFIIMFIYFFIDINRKNILLDWENNRCNPKYMFISGYIKNDTDNNIQYTYDNFIDCVNKNEYIQQSKQIIRSTDNKMNDAVNSIYKNEITITDNVSNNNDNLSSNYLLLENNKNIMENKMDLLYDQHKKIYNIMEMYINRTIFVIDYIFKYISNVFQYNLYNYKSQLNRNFITLNNSTRSSYISTMQIIQNSFNQYNSENYNNAYSKATIAISTLQNLINDMNNFESDNNTTNNTTNKTKIDNICSMMSNNSKLINGRDSCDIIFPNYSII
jgi:hypothetical protein